jgi:hypothetical protein
MASVTDRVDGIGGWRPLFLHFLYDAWSARACYRRNDLQRQANGAVLAKHELAVA